MNEGEVRIRRVFAELQAAHPSTVGDYRLVVDTRPTRRLGQCRHHVREVGVSSFALKDPDIAENTVRHEAAHALAGPGHGHDATWKDACRITGARPVRCAVVSEDFMPAQKWSFDCGLGCKGSRSRRASAAMVCKRHRSPLHWRENR